MVTIPVSVPERPYSVTIAAGALDTLASLLPDLPRGASTILVTSPELDAMYGEQVRRSLTQGGAYPVQTLTIADGEGEKTIATLTTVWEAFARFAVTRSDLILAMGGGVIGDLVGFAGATYNRGVGVVHIPTTLLAMVDSSVGGKTAINLRAGKNLVGAFHQPKSVVIDPTVLATLPRRARLAGLGEAVKYPMIAPSPMLELLTTHAALLKAEHLDVHDPTTLPVIERIVAESVRIKAAHVVEDTFEHGIRAHLNYGHTIGHVIEQRCGYGTWFHGEAVGMGMLVAARLGHLLGLCGAEVYDTTRDTLTNLDLPTTLGPSYPLLADESALWAVLGRDKKNRPGAIRFVLPTAIGAVQVVENPDRDAIIEAITVLA